MIETKNETSIHPPRAELHLHMDGSLRLKTLIELAERHGIVLPAATVGDLETRVFKPAYGSLDEYLQGFGLTCSVLRDDYSVRRVCRELFLDAAAEGVRYLEARMAPQLLARPGFTVVEVLKAMDAGFREAEDQLDAMLKPGMAPYRHGLIACVMRHAGPDHGKIYGELFARGYPQRDVAVKAGEILLQEVLEARQELGAGMCGFDLAGSEYHGPAGDFASLFASAEKEGFSITVHAGEARGAASMETAVKLLKARRIGHGTALFRSALDKTDENAVDRKELVRTLKERNVCMEVCLKSNLDTHAVPDLSVHPLRAMLDEGIPVCLNTDNRLISHTTLEEEYQRAQDLCGVSHSELKSMNLDAFRQAFFPGSDTEHQEYCRLIENEMLI